MTTSLGFTLLEEKDAKNVNVSGKKLNRLLNFNKTMKKESNTRITPNMVQEINRELTSNNTPSNLLDSNSKLSDEEDDNRQTKKDIGEDNNIFSGEAPSAIPNIYNDKPNYFQQYGENSPDNEFNKYMASITASSVDTYSPSSKNTVSMYSSSNNSPTTPEFNSPSSQKELLNKLNYMIHMLEEQQDQRTNSVIEELILYFFLGIFIIFVIDSFAKVGKYTR
jgi:hypothetical protein